MISPLPCRCHEGYHALDLGEEHYPRSLSAAVCVQSPHCHAHIYHVPVLTHRDKQSQPDQDSQPAPLVPEGLRKHWRFEYKAVPVSCECIRAGVRPGLGGRGHYDGALRGP